MEFDKLDEKEAVKRAFLLEKNGYRFYSILADRTDNEAARKVFKRLAADEMRHQRAFENRLAPEAGMTDHVTADEAAIEAALEKAGASDLFTRQVDVDALVKSVKGANHALLIALYTERHSVEYFERMAKEAPTDEARAMYDELAEEERGHVALIEGLIEAEKLRTKK